jgi:hypothetical protein
MFRIAAKDAYTECRQVARLQGVPVLLEPSGAAVSPPLTLKQCDRFERESSNRFEYIVSHKKDAGGACWIQMSFYADGFLQYGWVQASDSACGQSGVPYVHDCPSTEPACAQEKYCRQVRCAIHPTTIRALHVTH